MENGQVTIWVDAIDFPEPWIDLRNLGRRHPDRALARRLRKELRREISPGHPLSGQRWTIVASRAPGRDDLLVRLSDGSVALTHLTWKGSREPLPWPSTTLVNSPEEFRGELADRGYDVP